MGRKNRQRTTSQNKTQQAEDKPQNGAQPPIEAVQPQAAGPQGPEAVNPPGAEQPAPLDNKPIEAPAQTLKSEEQESPKAPKAEKVPKDEPQAEILLPKVPVPHDIKQKEEPSEPIEPECKNNTQQCQKGNQGQGNNKKGQKKGGKGGQQKQDPAKEVQQQDQGLQKIKEDPKSKALQEDATQKVQQTKQVAELQKEPQKQEAQKPLKDEQSTELAANPEVEAQDKGDIQKDVPAVKAVSKVEEEQVQAAGEGAVIAVAVTDSSVASSAEEVKSTETVISTEAPSTQSKESPLVQSPKVVEAEPAKPEAAVSLPEVKSDKDEKPVAAVSLPEVKETKQDTPDASGDKAELRTSVASDEDWQKREQELLKKIEDLEKVRSERSEDGSKLELKVRDEEIDLLKARVRNLETELTAALSKPGGKNHEIIENIKQQHEELLSKARGMIFDKTKMVKNQELQIEALTTQVQSLKDINLITRDLLEIRNAEVKAMEDRFEAMEAKFKAEKERYGLILQRAQTSTDINQDLKKEYETQLSIFKELREKYEQRVQALVTENTRLKESLHAQAEAHAKLNAPAASDAPPQT